MLDSLIQWLSTPLLFVAGLVVRALVAILILAVIVIPLAGLIAAREPMGKKLDFLLQEIQRELNTVSSKAPELAVVRLVLAGKETVEKIREQAQNVE